MTIIETERLMVRNFKPEDWMDLREYISKERVMIFECSWDSSEESLRKKAVEFSSGNSFWAVELKSTGKMIGHVYFNQVQPIESRTWILGYIFNNDYYGNGYATEACKGLLEYGFGNLCIHRVVAKCSPENEPSWKLLERLKMRREGHSIKCVTFKKIASGDPIWWDEYSYAILAEEWPGYDSMICKINVI